LIWSLIETPEKIVECVGQQALPADIPRFGSTAEGRVAHGVDAECKLPLLGRGRFGQARSAWWSVRTPIAK